MRANGHATGVLGSDLHLSSILSKRKARSQDFWGILPTHRIGNHKKVVRNQERSSGRKGWLALGVMVAAVPQFLSRPC